MPENTFSPEVREQMWFVSAGYCQCKPECVKTIMEYDHIVPNTVPNNRLFPLFLHSPFNCKPINQACHMQKGKSSITLTQASVYEKYLQSLLEEL